MDKAKCIFGNEISQRDYEKACKAAAKNRAKFGDDSEVVYHLQAQDAPVIGERLGVRLLSLNPDEEAARIDLFEDAASCPEPIETDRTVTRASGKPLVVGNIRMGFGHYRISMAIASAAHAMGFVPYWFDLNSFQGSTCSKLVEYQNKLYSMGSRLSQKVGPFNSLYWEPLNSEGFRQLTYNAGDQKNAELMTPVYRDLPSDIPFVATHAWPAQAAVHAGLTNVVNAIPDNWPMALHLAEGSTHTVQTPGAYLGYKMLRGMDGSNVLKPMPQGSIVNVGHYIDHELVSNIENDCAARKLRAAAGAPVRYLICIGGAGAQQDFVAALIEHLMPEVSEGRATLLINVGDHRQVYKNLRKTIPELRGAQLHFDDFEETEAFCDEAASSTDIGGLHVFYNSDIFAAVYSTNILMRICDVLVTKPSELAFYPVPKLMIKRVGGHEAWGAICTSELGDGTYELSTTAEACAMLSLLQQERTIITDMCDAIVAQNTLGTYDGAYRAAALAAGIDWQ